MSYEERLERQDRNERSILLFIAAEGFSTAQMLAELLGYKHPQSVYKILHRLEEKKFLRTYKMDFIGNLYLLTPTGTSQLDEQAEVKNIKPHEIKPYSMEHRLAIQKCHIAMIRNRVEWKTSTGKIKKGQQKPDGAILFTYDKEEKSEIAIEVELTIKTRKRYYQIYNSYISSRFKLILYVVPNEVLKKRLENILNDILNKHPHGLRYEHNHTNMQVFTMAKFSETFTAEYSEKRAVENKVRIQKAKEKRLIDQEAARKDSEEKARVRHEEQERLNRKYQEEQRALFPEPPPKKKKFGLF